MHFVREPKLESDTSACSSWLRLPIVQLCDLQPVLRDGADFNGVEMNNLGRSSCHSMFWKVMIKTGADSECFQGLGKHQFRFCKILYITGAPVTFRGQKNN